MIVDTHGHVTAPPELYAYKAVLLASRGYHGKAVPQISEERLREVLQPHIKLLKDVGTDLQLISPRPFQMMHSEWPAEITQWWIEANNDMIARQCALEPELFRGIAGLPQNPELGLEVAIAELERTVNELGFVGCLLNPDPTEGKGTPPPLGDRYWYPLYEKLVELDAPALIHSAGCVSPRESYSNHFITEESIGILSVIHAGTLRDFPDLKLIFPHGGGSVPYQIGRWRAARGLHGEGVITDFDDDLRRLYFDTVLYNRESLELLFRIVGTDRVVFGTEVPGSGSAKDPETGRMLDDLKPVIESIEWLDQSARDRIFESTARKLYTRI